MKKYDVDKVFHTTKTSSKSTVLKRQTVVLFQFFLRY